MRRDGMEDRLTQSIETALGLAEGQAMVDVIDGPTMSVQPAPGLRPLRVLLLRARSPQLLLQQSLRAPAPPAQGIGARYQVADRSGGAQRPAHRRPGRHRPLGPYQFSGYYSRLLDALSDELGFSLHVPWRDLSPEVRDEILHGRSRLRLRVSYRNRRGRRRVWRARYEGVIPQLDRRHRETGSDSARDSYRQYMRQVPCDECGGARLGEVSRAVTVGGATIQNLSDLFLGGGPGLHRPPRPVRPRDHHRRAGAQRDPRPDLVPPADVGLGYLTLGRSAATLAEREAQRIRLATQIGSGLVGVLYILDEPSIGLHQRDNLRLIETLTRLRDLGNTLLVVEHDEETIRSADHVVDIGPGGGDRRRADRGPRGRVAANLSLERSLDHRLLPGPGAGPSPPRRSAVPETASTSASWAPPSTTWPTWTWSSRSASWCA